MNSYEVGRAIKVVVDKYEPEIQRISAGINAIPYHLRDVRVKERIRKLIYDTYGNDDRECYEAFKLGTEDYLLGTDVDSYTGEYKDEYEAGYRYGQLHDTEEYY